MSNSGYACGKSSEKTSCEKKAVSKKEKSHSCQEDSCKKVMTLKISMAAAENVIIRAVQQLVYNLV